VSSQRATTLQAHSTRYNAGHLIEAAVAHYQLYKDRTLLDPLLQYIKLLMANFGPEDHQKHGYPGHPEIEIGLLRLYSITQDKKHLNFAKYFVQERGNPKGEDGKHYYDWEAEQRKEKPWERPPCFPMPRSYWYQQAHLPILEQRTIEGHSVRAMYLLTAVADLVRQESDLLNYKEALVQLWSNMVERKMYITGGIGAVDQWEGFGPEYFLPQSTDEGGCYAETCAAIGVMMLAQRMLQVGISD
jgi:uncharacterized protein